MSEAPGSPPPMPAGWYDDPFTDHLQRYWTGETWTKETRPLPGAVGAIEPIGGVGVPSPSGAPAEPPIRDYLIPSILVLIFCFWPLAIPAIYFAVKANAAKRAGDLTTARERSERARLFIMLAIIAGVLVIGYLAWDAWANGLPTG